MWSVREHDFTIRSAERVKYPVLGMVSFDPTGNDFAVIACHNCHHSGSESR